MLIRETNLQKRGSILFLVILIMSTLLISCSDDDDDTEYYGNWVESSTFDGDSRGNSVSFTIGDIGYVVTGYDGDDYLTDTWAYHSDGDYWEKLVDDGGNNIFTGEGRTGAVGFSINGKGYLGTGYNDDTGELADFWEFDPSTNTWTQKADFPGTARYDAIGFSVGDYGYIGTGYDGSEQKDFYKYDPATDSWVQEVGYGGDKRQDATVFVINDVAYIGTGIQNGAYLEDFYSFDGSTWTRLTDLDDDDDYELTVANAAGFSINGKGYISTGLNGSVSTGTWEYDPDTDTWEELPNFEGSARQDASAFTFDDTAYVLMGRSGSYYFDDVWELQPDVLENEDD